MKIIVIVRVSQRFNVDEINDFTSDLNLSKEAAELLILKLSDENVLEQGTEMTSYCTREKCLLPVLCEEENLVFCREIRALLVKRRLPEYFLDALYS